MAEVNIRRSNGLPTRPGEQSPEPTMASEAPTTVNKMTSGQPEQYLQGANTLKETRDGSMEAYLPQKKQSTTPVNAMSMEKRQKAVDDEAMSVAANPPTYEDWVKSKPTKLQDVIDYIVEQAEIAQTDSPSGAFNLLLDITFTGGPGGYFGSGAKHSPFTKGEIDIPKLSIPEWVINKAEQAVLSIYHALENIGFALGTRLWDVVGVESRPAKWGYELGQEIKGEHRKFILEREDSFWLGPKERWFRSNNVVERDGKFYYFIDPYTKEAIAQDIITIAVAFGVGRVVKGAAAGVGATIKLAKLVKGLSVKDLIKLADIFSKVSKAGRAGALKKLKTYATVGLIGGASTKNAISAFRLLGKDVTYGIMTVAFRSSLTAMNAGWAAGKPLLISGAIAGARKGATLGVAYGIVYKSLKFEIKAEGKKRGYDYDEDELHAMTQWAALSIFCSYYAGKLVYLLDTDEKFRKKAGKWAKGFKMTKAFIISEFIQYAVFSLGNDKRNASFEDFIEYVGGDDKPYTVDKPAIEDKPDDKPNETPPADKKPDNGGGGGGGLKPTLIPNPKWNPAWDDDKNEFYYGPKYGYNKGGKINPKLERYLT